jgi:hypothetical protein
MHILFGILSVLGIVIMILWRINQAADAARGAGDTAAEAHSFFEGWHGKNVSIESSSER